MMNPSLLVPPICLLLPPESLDSHKYNFQHKISIVLPLCTDTCLGCYDKQDELKFTVFNCKFIYLKKFC